MVLLSHFKECGALLGSILVHKSCFSEIRKTTLLIACKLQRPTNNLSLSLNNLSLKFAAVAVEDFQIKETCFHIMLAGTLSMDHAAGDCSRNRPVEKR